MYLISYCISIKNRLHQLKITLPENLKNTNQKIIICDFNSNDGLKDYIYNNYQNDITSKKLEYYFIDNNYWHASKCKNITHSKAKTKYIVNLDCDNFIGENSDEKLLKLLNDNTIVWQNDNIMGSGNCGRISMTKENFDKLGGYDESFYPMGYQDVDIVERAKLMGLKLIIFNENNKCIYNTKKESCRYIYYKIDYNKMNNYNKLRSKLNIDNNIYKVNVY